MRRFLITVGVLVLAGLGYVGWQVADSARAVSLPALPGPYPVGRVTHEWARGQRELSVWVWYPAARKGKPAPYAPGRWSALHLPAPVGWGESRFSAVRTRSSVGAEPAPGHFPLVVLEPGLGFSVPPYQGLAEGLASLGYTVAGVTPTYSANVTVIGGRVVKATAAGNPDEVDSKALNALTTVWADDALFVSRQLGAGERAYVGHSFGGSASLEACRRDPKCGGAVDLDGTQYGDVARTGLAKPVMIVQSKGSCVTGVCAKPDPIARRLLAASSGPHRCYSFDRTEHFGFTDYAAYHLAWPLKRLLPVGEDVITKTVNTIDAFLRGAPGGSQQVPC